MEFLKRYLPIAGLLMIIISVQLLTSATDTAYYLTQLTMAAYYSLVIIGLCVLMGYAGQISLGHAGFFAIGGYLSAALTSNDFSAYQETTIMQFMDKVGFLVQRQSLYGEALLNFHPWPACIIAVTVAIIIAFFLGIPVLKLKGHYLAMATLGFGIIIFRIGLAAEFFGEADGISEVPPFQLFPGISVNGDFADRVQNYYIAWGLLLLGLVLLLNLIHSRVGRALRSIHGSEEAAEAIGVNTARYKLYTFVISAAFAAVAGSFLTHYNGGIGPSEASVIKSVRYVAIVAVGGMANLWGALIMGILLNFMSLRGMFGTYDDAVFGAILILIMLFAPQGILSLRIKNIFRSRKTDS
jgi:branched-chain amino acid transport system permease protein